VVLVTYKSNSPPAALNSKDTRVIGLIPLQSDRYHSINHPGGGGHRTGTGKHLWPLS
jgi:hypothetical protein